jgi:NAD(P)-dependent dehydrogenase (short-subunit alcohol dehydrogenase family)
MIDLSQRTAVVTGGSSGIGRATAILLAQHNARVFVGDIALSQANVEFETQGITQLPCDVRQESDVSALVDQAVIATDRLDIAVHSAGIVMVKQIPMSAKSSGTPASTPISKAPFSSPSMPLDPCAQAAADRLCISPVMPVCCPARMIPCIRRARAP